MSINLENLGSMLLESCIKKKTPMSYDNKNNNNNTGDVNRNTITLTGTITKDNDNNHNINDKDNDCKQEFIITSKTSSSIYEIYRHFKSVIKDAMIIETKINRQWIIRNVNPEFKKCLLEFNHFNFEITALIR